jgi:hypothetical protein
MTKHEEKDESDQEVIITPEMAEAGAHVLAEDAGICGSDVAPDVARHVFSAMWGAKHQDRTTTNQADLEMMVCVLGVSPSDSSAMLEALERSKSRPAAQKILAELAASVCLSRVLVGPSARKCRLRDFLLQAFRATLDRLLRVLGLIPSRRKAALPYKAARFDGRT